MMERLRGVGLSLALLYFALGAEAHGRGALSTLAPTQLRACPLMESLPAAVTEAATSLVNAYYDEESGLFNTTGWWNSANALTTLTLWATLAAVPPSNATNVLRHLNSTFQIYKAMRFEGWYYDDEGWWGLCWVAASDLALQMNETRLAEDFLDGAEALLNDIFTGWGQSCGGGIWWSRSRSYKNAIPNELFLQLASALALRRGNLTTLALAKNELMWLTQFSGLINDRLLINDGLDANCTNNNGTTWSYNQGVILGGLVNLYQVEGNLEYLLLGARMAQSSMGALSEGGVLVEPCEPNCGADGSQFKGIYMRNMMYLVLELRAWLSSSPQRHPAVPRVRNFVREAEAFVARNAQSILAHDCAVLQMFDGDGVPQSGWFFGLSWRGPLGSVNASTQSSALDALVAALVLNS